MIFYRLRFPQRGGCPPCPLKLPLLYGVLNTENLFFCKNFVPESTKIFLFVFILQICSNIHNCVAHFVAHSDSAIGHMMFGFGGQLLLTGSISATVFNVFLLHLHPKSSALTSVQHIYTLNRGSTAAKVIKDNNLATSSRISLFL